MKKPQAKTTVKALSYQERLRRYEADKTELLMKTRGVSAYKLSEKLKELADKREI